MTTPYWAPTSFRRPCTYVVVSYNVGLSIPNGDDILTKNKYPGRCNSLMRKKWWHVTTECRGGIRIIIVIYFSEILYIHLPQPIYRASKRSGKQQQGRTKRWTPVTRAECMHRASPKTAHPRYWGNTPLLMIQESYQQGGASLKRQPHAFLEKVEPESEQTLRSWILTSTTCPG